MADSRHQGILEQMQTDIRAIGLSELRDDQVVILTSPDDYQRWLDSDRAGIILAPVGSESINVKSPGTNTSDDIGYPVVVAIIDSVRTGHSNTEQDKRLRWREQIIDTFIHDRLAGSINYDIDVEPGPIVDLSAWFSKLKFHSSLLFRVTQRVARRA